MKRTWLIPIIVLAVAIIGVVAYLARPRADEASNDPLINETHAPIPPPIEASRTPPALATCVGPMDAQVSKASIDAKHQWADSLLAKNHVDAAVTEFRNIATLDPGYPGINFEISDALLKSKHTSEAKDAVKLQLEISECLSKLPPPDMQTYCKSESMSDGSCVQALAKINQQAHYQAGLLDAGAGRALDPHTTTSISVRPIPPASSQLPSHPIASPATGPVAAAQPAEAAIATAPPKPPPPPKILAAEASGHVGERATVCGAVTSKNTSEQSNGKPTFVNLDSSFPNPSFTIVIWGSDSAAVGDFPGTGRVCVTGTIALYRGTPQIVVHDAQNWYRSGQ